MDAFSPEFAEHWLATQASVADEPAGEKREESLSAAQREALEELVERVSAARSIY